MGGKFGLEGGSLGFCTCGNGGGVFVWGEEKLWGWRVGEIVSGSGGCYCERDAVVLECGAEMCTEGFVLWVIGRAYGPGLFVRDGG